MKVKLKLVDVLNLEAELSGFADPKGNVIVEGLLNQPISYQLKYNLRQDLKNIVKEKDTILQTQDDLIKKYGNVDPTGRFGLDKFIPELDENGKDTGKNILNPNFTQYNEEWNNFILENTIDVELTEIPFSELAHLKTKDNYVVIDTYFLKTDE